MTTTKLLFLIFLIASCNCIVKPVEFSERARNFSIELMYFTRSDHFVVSPFCVWSLLTGAYAGGNGISNIEIQRATLLLQNNTVFIQNFKNLTNTLFESKSNGVELSTTTILFQDKDINILPSYKAAIKEQFNAQLSILDFQDTVDTKNQANRLIQNIFPAIWNVFHGDDFEEARLILSNVIHFRGLLSTPFNVSDTTEEIVYNDKSVAVGSVSMMHLKGKLKYSDFKTMESFILELPYGDDGKFCMLVIFPYPRVNPIVSYKKLDKILLRDIFTKLERDFDLKGSQEVEVKMPRFRLRTSLNLKDPFDDMGVREAFERDSASFGGISEDGLFIGTVEHKAELIFSESETVAFASTPGYFDQLRYSSYPKAQQPFIFFLMEKPTATIILGGIYSRHQFLNELNSRIVFNED